MVLSVLTLTCPYLLLLLHDLGCFEFCSICVMRVTAKP